MNSPISPNQPRIKQKNHKTSSGPQENYKIQSSGKPLTFPIRRKCLDLEESNVAKQTFISASQSPEHPSHLQTIQIIPTRNYTDSVQAENRMIQTFNQDTRAPKIQEANRYAINDLYLKSSNSIPSLKNHKPGTIKRVQQQSVVSNQDQFNPLLKSQENSTTNLKAFGKIVKNSTNQVKNKQINQQLEEELFQDPEIHLSSFDQTSGDLTRNHPTEVKLEPGVHGLHEGIQFLQQNLKQLEKKYKDLTQFQTQQNRERPQSKKLKQVLQSTSAFKKLQSTNEKAQSVLIQQKELYVQQIIDQLLLKYKSQLSLETEQNKIFDQLRQEVSMCLTNGTNLLLAKNQQLDEIKIELREALSQLDQIRSNHNLQLQQMETTMTELRLQNVDLRQKVDMYNSDLRSNKMLNLERESQSQEFQQKLINTQNANPHLTVEKLADQISRFFTAFRKLQKGQRKKLSNIENEQLEFEISKKDLQVALKNIGGTSSRKSVLDGVEIFGSQPDIYLQSQTTINQLKQELEKQEEKVKQAEIQRQKAEQIVKNYTVNLCNVKDFATKLEQEQEDQISKTSLRIQELYERIVNLYTVHKQLRQVIIKLRKVNTQQTVNFKSKEKELHTIQSQLQMSQQLVKTKEQNENTIQIQLKQLLLEKTDLIKQVELVKSESTQSLQNQENSNQKSLEKIQFKLDSLTQDNTQLQNTITSLQNKIKNSSQTDSQLSKEIDFLQMQLQQSQAKALQIQQKNNEEVQEFKEQHQQTLLDSQKQFQEQQECHNLIQQELETKLNELKNSQSVLLNEKLKVTKDFQKQNEFLNEAKSQIIELSEQDKQQKIQIQQLQNKIKDLQKAISESEMSLQKNNEFLNDQKQFEINKLQDNISELNREQINLNQTIANLQEKIETQQSNIDSQNIKEKDLEKQLIDQQFLTEDIKKQLEIQFTELEKEKQEFQNKLAQSEQKHQTAREQIEKKHQKVETEFNQTIKKLKSQIISQFEKRLESEKSQSLITNDPQTDTTATSNSAENQLKELQQKNQLLTKQIESLNGELESLSNKNSKQDLQLQDLQNQIESDQQNHKTEISNLQNQIDYLEDQEQERIQTLEQNLNLIQTLKKQLQKQIESNQKNKELIAELRQKKTDLEQQLQLEKDNFETFRNQNQQVDIAVSNQSQDKLQQTSQKLDQLHKQQKELKNYIQEIRDLQQNNFNEFSDEIQIQFTNAFDLKQKQLEQSFSAKQLSNSAQVQTYMNNMKQNFFDQESHIQRLQQENLQTKQALEQQIADLLLKLEFKQLENESSQASLQSQIEKLLQQSEEINDQLRDQAEELMAKNELIEEANNFIAEFNDEKHELKAKFKLLIGNLQDQDHSVSSYKSTDVVDIDKCFEILEQEIFMRSTQIHQSNQQNQRNTNILQDLVFTHVESQSSQNQDIRKKQDLIQQQQNQIVLLKSTLQQLQRQFENNWQNVIEQMKLAQEKIQLLETSLFESKEEVKKIQNENLNLQIVNQNLENELLEKPLDAEPHNSISLNSNHNESLIVENAQLLQKLQKAEKLLQEARDNGSTKQPFLQQSIKFNPEEIEQKLDTLRKKLITCIQDVTSGIQQKVQEELVKVKESYFQDKITIHNMANNCIVESWNDQVEIVTQLVIKSELYFIIQMKDTQINILKSNSLSNSSQSYLMGFVSEVDGMLYIDDETKVLKELVKELAQDLLELRQEYVQYQADLKLEHIDNTEIALMDEVEYLTGENKELLLKTKQLCLQNAQLKLQLLQFNNDCEESHILSDRQIEKEHSDEDFISDHDSFRQVIANDMNQNNNQLEMKLQTAELHIQDLTEKLQFKNGADQQDISCVSETTTLAHIKGTLLQFLKATPLTEKSNEELLKIIFSMLTFTQAEIKELHNQRQNIKGAKTNSTKKGSSSQQIQGQISDSKSQVTEEQSSEKTDKILKRGILGMIKNVVMNTQTNGEKVNKEPVLIAPQPAPIRR